MFCLISAMGCGGESYGPTGTVDGKLTLEGNPLQSGTAVVFQHQEKGFLAYGQTDAEGNYRISSFNAGNLPVGRYSISIQPPPPKVDEASLDAHELIENPKLIEQTVVVVDFPERYRDTRKSKLEFEVNEGPNRCNLQLTGDTESKQVSARSRR